MSDRASELRPLTAAVTVAFAMLVASIGVLLLLTPGTVSERLAAVDERLFLTLCGACSATGPSLFSEVVRDVTALGSLTVTAFLTLSVVLFLVVGGRGREAVFLVVTIALGVAVTFLIKDWLARPRPVAPPGAPYVVSSSFPSGHAATAALVYLVTAGVAMPLLQTTPARVIAAVLAVVVTIAIGSSRVWLGLHHPSDVVAGWLLGGGWAMLALALHGRFFPRSANREAEP